MLIFFVRTYVYLTKHVDENSYVKAGHIYFLEGNYEAAANAYVTAGVDDGIIAYMLLQILQQNYQNAQFLAQSQISAIDLDMEMFATSSQQGWEDFRKLGVAAERGNVWVDM